MKSVSDLYPGTEFRDIMVSNTEGWSAHNPSIARGPDGYRCIIRSVNYVYRNGEFIPNDPAGVVRTRNYICDLDDSLQPVSMDLIDVSRVEGAAPFPHILNMEDARLFWNKNSWWVSGTVRYHRADGVPKIAVDRLEGNVSAERRILKNDDDICEKNWMPIVGTGRWVYSVSPSKVVRNDGYLDMNRHSDIPPHIRGSSQLVPWKDGYLGVTHEVTWEPTRYYWHRFIYFDSRGLAVSATEPFYFLSPGVEFANGLTVWQDKVVVSFGKNEERAILAVVPGKLL